MATKRYKKFARQDDFDDYEDDFEQDRTSGGSFDPKRLFFRILSRWPWLLLGLLIGLAVAYVQVKRAIPKYKSTATLLVKGFNLSATGQFDPSDIDLRGQDALETIRARFDQSRLYEKVASDPVVRKLDTLKPGKPVEIAEVFSTSNNNSLHVVLGDAPPAQQLAGMIRSWTSSQVRKDSRFIDVTVTHPDPKVAKVLVDRLVYHFIDIRESDRTTGAEGSLEYFVGESERISNELENAQSTKASYATAFSSDKVLVDAEEALATLKVTKLEKNPAVIKASRLVDVRKEDLMNHLKAAVQNPLDQEYWNEHPAATSDLSVEENFNRVRLLLQARQATLESKVSSLSDRFEIVEKNINDKQVDVDQSEAEAVPHENGRLAGKPFSPDIPQIVIQGAGIGLFGGLLLAFLFQFLDNKITSVEDVEQLVGLPTLAAVRKLPDARAMRVARRKAKIPKSLSKITTPLAVTNFDSKQENMEMFRVLRAAMILLGDREKRKVTLITSSEPGEGKTFVSANLAFAYARQGTRTLLIDFDLRKPAQHKIFGEKRDSRPGMVDLLTNSASVEDALVSYKALPELSVIFAGPKSPSPGELLDHEIITELLDQFKNDFDHIIIDSAPLLAVPDTRVLSEFADNLALVVRADVTPHQAVNSAIELLESANATPNGIILNGFTEKRFTSYGKYKYGYQYGKYSDYGDDE